MVPVRSNHIPYIQRLSAFRQEKARTEAGFVFAYLNICNLTDIYTRFTPAKEHGAYGGE